MDRRERFNDLNTTLLAMLAGWQAGVWTALPAIIHSFNPATMTVTAQPAIQGRVQSKGSTAPLPGATLDVAPWWWSELPLLVDVPVILPGGGGFTLTFPISEGDEALIIFSSKCIDAWWQLGGVQVQAELRMHDLSDGFALVGPRSQPRVIGDVSSSSAQLRSDDGSMFVELAAGHVMNIVAPGGVTINGVLFDAAGNMSNVGTLNASGEGTFNGHTVGGHRHGGVEAGSSNTNTPSG